MKTLTRKKIRNLILLELENSYTKNQRKEIINEGDCGCSSNCRCAGKEESESVVSGYPFSVEDFDYHGYLRKLLNLPPSSKEQPLSHSIEQDFMSPGEAVGVGYAIADHDHKSGSYMAKSQMYKVSKYAARLYEMIPDNYNLEDWMRTKLSQISDDIGEVYHALDHDIFKGEI